MTKVSIGQAWEETSKLLASERRLLVPIALAFLVVPVTLGGLAAPNSAPTDPAPALSVITVVTLLLGLVGRLALSLLATGRQGKLADLIIRSGKRLIPLVVALAIVVVPLAAMFYGVDQLMPAPGSDPASVPAGQALTAAVLVFVLLALLLLAAARLILPVVPAAAVEDLGPIALLKRSWDISRGNFWRLLVVVMLVGIAALAFLFAAQAVVGSIATLSLGKPVAWSVSRLVVALASAVTQAVVVTVGSVLVARIYVQLAANHAKSPAA